tara:strand:- start:39525 stop:39683 length:159 start_codon:yes stop_codon:yes gene_type:complete
MKYVRPNLSPEQRDSLVLLLEDQLKSLSFDDPKFEPAFKLRTRLKDAKTITT